VGNPTGFIEFPRVDVGHRPVEERVRDWHEIDRPLVEQTLRQQAARCMDCGIPFCHGAGCPVKNRIPEFNDLVYRGLWQAASENLHSTNNFPEITGRVCPAPCESACTLAINSDAVTIKHVEYQIAERAFREGWVKPIRPAFRTGKRVAVIGSGPAGLAVAQQLTRQGHEVVVFEKDDRIGGLLRYGIPDFKLEKWVVDQRLDLLRQEGVVFECGVDAGTDVSHRFLRDRFEAIVLAGGAGVPRDLPVPGRELDGIHFAMDFLAQQNRIVGGEPVPAQGQISAAGKNVAVIGGGDTGSDCIGTAWRQGARHVVQLEILPEPPPTRAESTPWPQWPLMRRDSSSHKEGGTRLWGANTTAFAGEQGRVTQVHGVQVEWVAEEDHGPVRPREIPGSAFTLHAELVLIAMGFVGPSPTSLVEGLGIAKDARGFVGCDERHMTNIARVFVAGDMRRGASLVVHAMADGLQAARDVLEYLDSKGGGLHA